MGEGGAGADAGDHLTPLGDPGPSVSVVTIAWRNERCSRDFLGTLADAAEEAGWAPELVLVVNGPEGEAAAAALLGAAAGTRLHPVVVRLDDNAGYSGGANAGVNRATGDVVVVANLDLTFDPAFLRELGREVADHTWDLLAPAVRQGTPPVDQGVSGRTRSHRLAWAGPDAPPAGAPVRGGNGACLVLRRTTLQRRVSATGCLFDPEYHSFNEDIDLFWWAEDEGLVVRRAPQAQVSHEIGGSFGGRYRFRDRPAAVQVRIVANYRVTVWKHARRPAEWLGWAVGEAEYLGQAVAARGPGGLATYARSWPLAIATARAIRRRRRSSRLPVGLPSGRLEPGDSRS